MQNLKQACARAAFSKSPQLYKFLSQLHSAPYGVQVSGIPIGVTGVSVAGIFRGRKVRLTGGSVAIWMAVGSPGGAA